MSSVLRSLGLLALVASCGQGRAEHARPTVTNQYEEPVYRCWCAPEKLVSNARVVFEDGLHNENTEMIRYRGRVLLAFRGGETGQTGSANAYIAIHESNDAGATFHEIARVSMPDDPNDSADDRDIRDPKFVSSGRKLSLYAISRVPGFAFRDLGGQAWTVRSESIDGGYTWSVPQKIFEDITLNADGSSSEEFWGFWRFKRGRGIGCTKPVLYATGYNDGDSKVGLFASTDGIEWHKRGIILDSYLDVPSEAELNFFGSRAVALVRLDNQGILTDGQTAICTADPPYDAWECGRRLEQRFDGPTWIVRRRRGKVRNFVVARKHLPCTRKRTAVYELRGDLADPAAEIEVCEVAELPSSGDTAYASVVRLNHGRNLLSWYSSAVATNVPWLQAQFMPSNIWMARLDFAGLDDGECTPPTEEAACEPPPLPPGQGPFDLTGQHLLTIAPSFWPELPVLFVAETSVALDADGNATIQLLALQPLSSPALSTHPEPVGDPWVLTDLPVERDGSFTADFGVQPLPAAAYPLIPPNQPTIAVQIALTGTMISTDKFCGSLDGAVRFSPAESDRLLLSGSTWGAVRINPGGLPQPTASCE